MVTAKQQRYAAISLIAVCLFFATACAYFPGVAGAKGLSAEDIDELSAKVMLVSKKAEALVRYTDQPMTAGEIKSEIARKNPELMNAFRRVWLDYRVQGAHATVQVCDRKRQYLIMEDSACTAQIDVKSYTPGVPCGPVLETAAVCMH